MSRNVKIREPKRLPMVGWYDPRRLAQTAVEVAISTIFGRHSDHRLIEAMAFGDDKKFYDYTCYYKDDGQQVCEPDISRPRNSIWIDYVADVGDGWNSTYTIAYCIAGQSQSFSHTDRQKTCKTTKTHRGDILIFGGDEVYPTASRESYQDRLVAPYETALRTTDAPSPHVFAIPGNHDWYDSLVAFTRLFTARPWFAGWRTRQSRSYFALKLPHNWWLLGTDVQLGSDIDAPQMKYFANLSKEMEDEEAKSGNRASIILCHAEPHWIRAAQYEGIDHNYSESNLKLLERKLGKNIAVFIAGDLHHYRRHEAADQCTQKITAGGGGAFLHPTHAGWRGKKLDNIVEKDLGDEETANPRPDQVFHLKGCFPSPRESSRTCLRNLLFPFFIFMRNKSWSLGLASGGLYLLLTFLVMFRINDSDFLALSYLPGNVLGIVIDSVVDSAVVALLVLLTVAGFVFFTDTHKKIYRFVGGGMHGIAHVLAANYGALVFVSELGNNLSERQWRQRLPWPEGFEFFLDFRILAALVLIFLSGFVLGTFIMGLYLLISLNVFGRHGNEAFSSLAVEDWKNFLRLQIDENGNLTIYPIGIRRVPRGWKRREQNTGPELVPNDSNATEPTLIEPPIFMKKAETGTGVKRAALEKR
ncbi:MAG: metallophosphoesterase [Candidatus Binatia bacterium]